MGGVCLDDIDIINNLKADKDIGYTMMIEKYTPYISSIVYGMGSGKLTVGDMEELVADTFFKLWKSREKIVGESLKALLAQTARNTCIDEFRRRKLEFLPLEEDALFKTSDNNVHELFEREEQMKLISNAVDEFGEPDREIFIRYYYFGEKQSTISNVLDVNLSTVKTKLKRAREKLKEILCEGGYEYE